MRKPSKRPVESRKNLRTPLLALILCALSGCRSIRIQEERYPDGNPRSSRAYLLTGDSCEILHGAQRSWYPGGGLASLEFYDKGYRQGYVFRWRPDGRLRSLEHFTDGILDKEAKYWDDSGSPIPCGPYGCGADFDSALVAE